jgi:ribosome-binding ATPase
MALKCGIIGLSATGKTTLFNCISKSKIKEDAAQTTHLGQVEVPDPRMDVLIELIKPAKVVHTTVEIVDIPGLMKSTNQAKAGNQFLADIRQTDAIIHVLRCFDSEIIPHVDGSVDPVRDKENIDLELVAKDLETLEKKMQKVEKLIKVGDKDAKIEHEVLSKLREHFENGEPARSFQADEKFQKYIDDCFFLSIKPVVYVCNVDEASAASGNKYSQKAIDALSSENAKVLVIAAQAEADIAELEDSQDREVFLNDLGLDEPGVNKLVRAAYELLNLKTFFTAGPKEARAWTIREGMTAPQAAGVIHSDLERGFIRAEVMKFEDLKQLGSEQACKNAGKYFVEGKNYIVKDGDILNIRFNV